MLTLAALGCAFAFQTTLLGSSRSWRNGQNGLFDHLVVKGSKSQLCQVQLCIKVVPFQKQEFWVPKSQCISLGWACLGSSAGILRGICQSFGRHWTGPWKQLWSGSGRLWTVLMNSEEVWAVLDCSGRRWTALGGLGSFEWPMELARSLPKVGIHVLTSGGKHILLSQCFTSRKRARSRKS